MPQKLSLKDFFILATLPLLLLCFSCNSKQEKNTQNDTNSNYQPTENTEINQLPADDFYETENLYICDLNADSIPDSFYVIPPQLHDEEGQAFESECFGPCMSKIKFLQFFPSIFVQESIGGEITVLEDINENGFREIVFFPYWFNSCWSRMDIFSFDGEKWKLIHSQDYNSCEESLPTSFEKIEKNQLRIFTNGEKFEEILDNNGKIIKDILGLEAKIIDITIE
jgi:hypothetical protein